MRSCSARRDDWEARLHAAFDERATRAFAWGQWDCALAVAEIVEALTGDDFGAPFRGRYTTPLGAVRALKRFGAGDLAGTFTAALGEPVHPAFARRGDVVLGPGGRFGSAGLWAGSFALVVVEGGYGWSQSPRADFTQAWAV